MTESEKKPANIDEVLIALDAIIDDSIRDNDYLGIFAYVYRRTTAQIRQAIIDKQFEDNERMASMDVVFAGKYIEAYRKFNKHETVSGAWSMSFMAKYEKLTIMQHLLLGMNAHINLDLGIAASETSSGDSIASLKNDFMKVNDILAGLTDLMQIKVSRISWWMFLLNWIGGKTDEVVINFSIAKAREQAWELAKRLAYLDDGGKRAEIQKADEIISTLAGIIKQPPGKILNTVLKFISNFEEKDIKMIIKGLEE